MMSSHSESQPNEVKIEAIKPHEKRINIVFEVVSKGSTRKITKRNSGEIHHVCDLLVADETAAITLTLGNEDIDLIEVGRVYKFSNCFVNVYRNSLRLSKDRFRTLAEEVMINDPMTPEKIVEVTDVHLDVKRIGVYVGKIISKIPSYSFLKYFG